MGAAADAGFQLAKAGRDAARADANGFWVTVRVLGGIALVCALALLITKELARPTSSPIVVDVPDRYTGTQARSDQAVQRDVDSKQTEDIILLSADLKAVKESTIRIERVLEALRAK